MSASIQYGTSEQIGAKPKQNASMGDDSPRQSVHLYEDQAATLLRVFERYCMATSRGNYRFLRLMSWLRLLRDTGCLDSHLSDEESLKRRILSRVDAELIFQQCTSQGQSNLMQFEDLCYGLQQVALWKYEGQEPAAAMEMLLTQDVFPATHLEDDAELEQALKGYEDAVQAVLAWAEEALAVIYKAYVTSDSLPAGVETESGGGFSLDHKHWLALCKDFDITPHVNEAILSRFFCSSHFALERPGHSLTFAAFLRCICRSAVHAYSPTLEPPAAVDRLICEMAASEAFNKLERDYHLQKEGRPLTDLLRSCQEAVPSDSSQGLGGATHRHYDLGGEAEELLDDTKLEALQNIFDTYVAREEWGERMGSRQFFAVMKDTGLLDEDGLSFGDVDIAFGTEACRRSTLTEATPSIPTWDMRRNAVGFADQSQGGGSRREHKLDLDGFVRALLHVACRKFPEASSEVEALDLILSQYILPNASYNEAEEEGDKAGDDLEVAEVFAHFAKDLRSFYDIYATTGRPESMSRDQYFKFARDFAIMPRLCTRKEIVDSFKMICGEGDASFEQFTDVVIEQAVIGFSKATKADVYQSLGDKAKGMVMHLTTCLGREKAGIPMNRYAVSHYQSYDELVNPERQAKVRPKRSMIRTAHPDMQPSRRFPLLGPKDSVVRFLEAIRQSDRVDPANVFDMDPSSKQCSESNLYEQYKAWCEATASKRHAINKFRSMIPNDMVKEKGSCRVEGEKHGAMKRWLALR